MSTTHQPQAVRRADPLGVGLCLLAAAGFGALPIFAKSAFETGLSVVTVLFVRFVLATGIFGALLAGRPSARAALRRVRGRDRAIGFGLGAVGYAAQAGLFFAGLQRLNASLLALILYTYPAWVMLGAFLLGIERPSRRGLVALALSWTGLGILLAGGTGGGLDPLGVALGVATALVYATYILVADRVGPAIEPLALTTLVCSGAATTFAIAALAGGSVGAGMTPQGWLWVSLIAVVSTAIPISAFFAGLARIGPSPAAIVSSLDPVVTVVLASVVLGESLAGVQLVGAAFVLTSAVLIASPTRNAPRVPPE